MWNLLLVSLVAVVQPTVELQTLSGTQVTGTLSELGAKQIAVQTAQGPVTMAIDTLLAVSTKGVPAESPAAAGVWAELIDGSSLIATDYSCRGGNARIVLPGGKALEVPTQQINWVRLQAQGGLLAGEWSKIVDAQADGDLLVARKGDAIDYHKGVLRDVTDTVVKFDVDGELVPVQRAKVHGLVYFHARGAPLPDSICRVTDAAGSCWAVRSIALRGETLEWTTPAGLSVTRPLAEVSRIDFSQGKIVYLADLKPESSSWTPYFGTNKNLPARSEFFGPRSDRSPRAVELNGKQQPKGMALHSRAYLVYRLPGKFRRFKALVGIDDRVRPHGNVRFVVLGDDRVLLETTVAGTEPAKQIDLDLTGMRRLSILVDFGENLDVADHLGLGEARIVK